MNSISVPYFANYFQLHNQVDINQKTNQRDCANDEFNEDILCLHCDTSITANKYKIIQHNNHHHTFANPSGKRYTLGCFSDAQNTKSIGRPTEEWSWFSGYAWTICLCANCNTHLGWRFDKPGEQSFFAFILDQLKS